MSCENWLNDFKYMWKSQKLFEHSTKLSSPVTFMLSDVLQNARQNGFNYKK